MASREYVVKHSMLGVINPKSGDPHYKGETVSADLLGDKANIDRLIGVGAIEPKSSADKREETPGTPSEAEELALEQSRIVDLDPAASPLADHQELTDQQLNKDQGKGAGKK
jgi:hypothetical protein